jgi:hypothetical protein
MTLPELHVLLDRLEIVLSVRGDLLHWTAPPGAMTPEVKAALAVHKPALLALLAGADSSIDPAPPALLSDPVPAPWPPRPAELAEWPVEWRARWGLLANELQDQEVPWPEHERRAFDLVKAEKERMDHPPCDPAPEPGASHAAVQGRLL